jgi:peptidoglycan/xylan/chitin deacetylase (PgdA/CDA1 family)
VKEKFFRQVLTNVIIAVVVLGVFGLTYFTVDTQARGNPDGAISRGSDSAKVSLMFNVYSGIEYLDDVLKVLDANKISATFFVSGSWVSGNEESLQRIAQYGHELGNGGYFRQDHSQLSAQRNREEISTTHQLVSALLNIQMTNFSPPFGVYNKYTISEATNLGYKTIMWTTDTQDWREQNGDIIFRRATERVKGGDFILMQPTKSTVQVLQRIVDAIRGKGFSIAPIREVI